MEAVGGKNPECAMCLSSSGIKLFKCGNNHVCCFLCCGEIFICPICEVNIFENKQVANPSWETMLDSMTFDCPYKRFGCQQRFPRVEILNHKTSCEFGGTKVKLCELLGFSCDYVTWNRSLEMTKIHFEAFHGAIICHKHNGKSQNQNVANPMIAMNGKLFWNPVLTNLFSNWSVLIQASLTEPDQAVVFHCVNIYHDVIRKPKEMKWKINFMIKSINPDEQPDLLWEIQPFELKQANLALQTQPFPIPLYVLSQYAVGGTVTVCCKFLRNGKLINTNSPVEMCAVFLLNLPVFGSVGKTEHYQKQQQ